MRTSILLAAGLAASTLSAQDLTWNGATLGGSVTYDLAGDPGDVYALLPSLMLATIPLPGGAVLNVGLDQLSLLQIGLLSPADGTAQVTFGLPLDPGLAGLPIHAQFVTLLGPPILVDQVSDRNTFVAGFPGSIENTFGLLGSSRVGHSQTTLADGDVLIVGGAEDSGLGFTTVSDTVERYERDRQEFTAAGTLLEVRSAHSATLLDDGRVLLVGGIGATNQPLATAEVYDPASGTSSSAGSMSTARTQHTATKMADGRVLVVAGTSSFDSADLLATLSATLSTAEIYDPVANSWSSAASLPLGTPFGAIGQGASLMNDGRVLVTGGAVVTSFFGIPTPTISNGAWRYDAGTNSWLSTASMATARVFHGQLTEPDGRVLIAAGATATFLPTVTATPLASCERYGPGNSFAGAGSLIEARAYPILLDPGDGILCIGGLNSVDIATFAGVPSQLIESASYGGSSWSSVGTTLLPRELLNATVLDGGDRVLITGAALGATLDQTAEQLIR